MPTEINNTGVTFPDATTQTTAATGDVPSGSAMLFVQTAAPTGWTKSTTHNNKALQINRSRSTVAAAMAGVVLGSGRKRRREALSRTPARERA